MRITTMVTETNPMGGGEVGHYGKFGILSGQKVLVHMEHKLLMKNCVNNLIKTVASIFCDPLLLPQLPASFGALI